MQTEAEEKKLKPNKFAEMTGAVIEESGNSREGENGKNKSKLDKPLEPEVVVTTRESWHQPWIKIFLVGSVVFVAVAFIYGAVNGSIQAVNDKGGPDVTQTENKKDDTLNETDETENPGELKTKVALTSQKRELKDFNVEKEPKAETEAEVPEVEPTPTPNPQPTLNAVQTKPKVVYVTRPSAPPPPPLPTTRISRSPVTTIPENIDPMKEWLAASNIGVYGSASISETTQTQEVQIEDIKGETGEIVSPEDGSLGLEQNVDYSTKRILVGSHTDGQLKTPVMWGGNIPPQENQSYLIQLSKPLKGFGGSEILPKGSYLVAKVINSNSSGFVQMEATSSLVNINSDTQEKQIPDGSILILSRHGEPLKAKSHKGKNVGNIVLASILGGVEKAAQIENQASSVTSFNSTGFSSITTDGEKNLAAGFAEGSLRQVLSGITKNQEKHLQKIKSEPKVFVIKSGTDVRIFVNRTVSL